MHFFTAANNFTYILNELIFWSDISSEHPIFIKTLGELTEKKLPRNIIDMLIEINQTFSTLNKSVIQMEAKIVTGALSYNTCRTSILVLIEDFLIADKQILDLVLPSVKTYGKDDRIWQELLKHITHEQKFMYKLFCSFKIKII
jgi:hypothetical protein